MSDLHIPGDRRVKYGDQVYLVFDKSGTFNDKDHSAFDKRLCSGHFNKGDRCGPYIADSHDHDDAYDFEPDDGLGFKVMNTIHIRSTTLDGEKIPQLDSVKDVAGYT